MMQESSRFTLFSGLAGVIIGIYALIGSFVAYSKVYGVGPFDNLFSFLIIPELISYGIIIFIISVLTILLMTFRRVKKAGKKIWNTGSKLMLLNLAIPLLAGGVFILIFINKEIYEIVSPACLIFYGLALVNASKFSRHEIFQIGLFEIFLGLLAAYFASISLIFWAIGFGVVHIVYGLILYFKYEYRTNE